MIRKYRKIKSEVDAIVWTGENNSEILEFCRRCYIMGNELIVKNNNGDIRVTRNNYIVKEINGEFHTYDIETFYKLYKPV